MNIYTHSVLHNLLGRHVNTLCVGDHGEAGLPMYIRTTTLSLPHKPYIVATVDDTQHHDDYIEWLQTYTYYLTTYFTR